MVVHLQSESTPDLGRLSRVDVHDVPTGHLILIENQLERTDYGPLGQLITYAAGLKTTLLSGYPPCSLMDTV
jgi:hypothetical protein